MTERAGLADGAAVFVSALCLYAATLAPTVVWGDSASLAVNVWVGHLSIGSAGDHPLFVFLGRSLLPLPGELAWKLNLLTAASSALALALVYAAATRLGGSRWAGAGTVVALAFSHAFWHYSVIASVRTLNALFLALLVSLMLEWRARGAGAEGLVVPAAVFLLGLTNHLVLALALPGLAFFALATRKDLRRRALWLLLVLGSLGIAALPLLPAARQALAHVWYGPPPIYHYVVHWPAPLDLAREAFFYLGYLGYQFPGLALVLGVVGLRDLLRRDWRAAIGLLLVAGVNGFVIVKTTEWSSLGSTKFTFYMTDYLVFAIFVGLGTASAARARGRIAGVALLAALALLPVATYAAAPALLGRLGLDPVRARHLPYRDEARFFLTPSKRGDLGARRFGEEALLVARPGSLVVADFTPFKVLQYLQIVEGRRRDVILVESDPFNRPIGLAKRASCPVAGRPVYLAGRNSRYYDVAGLVPPCRLEPRGPLLEVLPPATLPES